jgi:hypothetical protein
MSVSVSGFGVDVNSPNVVKVNTDGHSEGGLYGDATNDGDNEASITIALVMEDSDGNKFSGSDTISVPAGQAVSLSLKGEIIATNTTKGEKKVTATATAGGESLSTFATFKVQ